MLPLPRPVFRLSLAVAALLASFGCAPGWTVIRASGPPSALKGTGEVAVAFDYSRMQVEDLGEEAWVAAKLAEDPRYRETWADLKGRLEAAVVVGLRSEVPRARALERGGAAPLVLQVQVTQMKLGKFIPFVLPPTVVEADLLWQVDGKPADLISVKRSMGPTIYTPSVFQHIGPVGQGIGSVAGKFWKSVQ